MKKNSHSIKNPAVAVFCLLALFLFSSTTLFAAGAKISYNRKKGSVAAQKTDVSGSWRVTFIPTGGSRGRMDLRLKQSGGKITVSSYSYVGGNSEVWKEEPDGAIKAGKITLYFEEKGERATYRGTVSGNRMSGTLSFGGTWSAVRLK